jgi:hypothetical protein
MAPFINKFPYNMNVAQGSVTQISEDVICERSYATIDSGSRRVWK